MFERFYGLNDKEKLKSSSILCAFSSLTKMCVGMEVGEPWCAPEITFQATVDVCVPPVVRAGKGRPSVVCQGHVRLV